MRRLQLAQILAVAAIAGSVMPPVRSIESEISEARQRRNDKWREGLEKNEAVSAEHRAWNAAVDVRKAEKKRGKL